jgi:hypothetical protein
MKKNGFFKLSTFLRRPIINPLLWNKCFSRNIVARKTSYTMSIVEPIHVNELPKPGEIFRLKNNYIEGEPLKLILQDEQHSTETLWWPSKNNDENYILVVIPGNPGVIDYYVEFLSTVHDELGKKIDIVGGS